MSARVSATEAYNGYIAAHVIYAMERLDMFTALRKGPIDLAAFVKAHPVDAATFRALIDLAIEFGYLIESADSISLTDAGEEAYRLRGFFTWAVGGYADVFRGADTIAANRGAYGVDVCRDEAMVALGSAQAGVELMADTVSRVLAQVDFGVLADLGSGTSARICDVISGRPGTRGIGLDISAPATAIGEQTVKERNLESRVQALRADVLDVIHHRTHRETFAEVDTVMSFFLLHDLLADPAKRSDVLPRMREAFPAATTFLLADTVRRAPGADGPHLPIFSTGFELAHGLMGVPLYTKTEYERLFQAAGLRFAEPVALGAPHSWLFVLHTD